MNNRLIIYYSRIETCEYPHYKCCLDTGINSYHDDMDEILRALVEFEYPVQVIKDFMHSETYRRRRGTFIWGDGVRPEEIEFHKKDDAEIERKRNEAYFNIKAWYKFTDKRMEEYLKDDPMAMEGLVRMYPKIKEHLDADLKDKISLELSDDPECGGEPDLLLLFPIRGYCYDNPKNEEIDNKVTQVWMDENSWVRIKVHIMEYNAEEKRNGR